MLLLLIMLLLFGPNQMRENAKKTAQAIRRFLRSDTWRTFLGLYDDVNNIREEVIRESGIREVQDSLRGVNRQLNDIDKDIRRTDPVLDEGSIQKAEITEEANKPHEPESGEF